MREEHIKVIREKCIAANPEIVELKFGCEVSWQYEHALNQRSRTTRQKKGIFVNYGGGNLRNPMPVNVLFYGNSSVKQIQSIEELEIIGRPIRLADVLYMMSKLALINYPGNKFKTHPHNVSVTTLGYALNENGMHLFEWNLLQDSLESQSDECLAFLANLIK